jgi:hypothetical protein
MDIVRDMKLKARALAKEQREAKRQQTQQAKEQAKRLQHVKDYLRRGIHEWRRRMPAIRKEYALRRPASPVNCNNEEKKFAEITISTGACNEEGVSDIEFTMSVEHPKTRRFAPVPRKLMNLVTDAWNKCVKDEWVSVLHDLDPEVGFFRVTVRNVRI